MGPVNDKGGGYISEMSFIRRSSVYIRRLLAYSCCLYLACVCRGVLIFNTVLVSRHVCGEQHTYVCLLALSLITQYC